METAEMTELKEAVVKQVQKLKFVNEEDIENYKVLSSESRVERFVLPMHYVEIYYAKYLFVENYCDGMSGEPFFTNNFKINKDEINRIVATNDQKKFLHFFFCNIKLPGSNNDLGLIFRFSDIETYNTDEELDTNDGEAYLLIDNGAIIQLDSNTKFTQIRHEYKLGIANEIVIQPHHELTEYITYSMSNLLLFKGFEHDLVFELICKENNIPQRTIRLGLVVYIKDKDRLHHINITSKQYFEGYYDAGDLKP
jgi:hypothetical protein